MNKDVHNKEPQMEIILENEDTDENHLSSEQKATVLENFDSFVVNNDYFGEEDK